MQGKKKKSFPFSSFFHFSFWSPFCFTSFESLLSCCPGFSRFSFFTLSVCPSHYFDKPLPLRSAKVFSYSATGLSINRGQSLCTWALNNIMQEPIKKPN